jgi:hypothetical protein
MIGVPRGTAKLRHSGSGAPLHDARTTITFDQSPNQDPVLAPKQDLCFGTGRYLTYRHGDLKCLALSEPAPKSEWPDGTRVMVRKGKSWREVTIITRLDHDHWRAQYPGCGSGMFHEADIRAYDPKSDATLAKQLRRAKATASHKSSRSRYAIDPEAIAAGKLPDKAPVVTSKANPHYQKHFDRLFALAKAGDWDAVRDYKVTGSNSYSKMVARYRQDLLAFAAVEAAQ